MALTVRLLSQGMIIHNPPAALTYYLDNMVHPNLVAPKLKRERGRFITEDGDLYYYCDKAANDYYYHIKQLEPIKAAIELAQSRGQLGEVEYVKQPQSEGSDVKFKNYRFDLRVPMDNPEIAEFFGFQNEVSDTACEPDRLQTIFEIQTGRGKAGSIYEPLLTPDGWRLMGDIKVGDKVIGSNGKATDVTGVFPQPDGLDTYEITTYDGRKLKACGEHLWYSFYVNTTEKKRWGVRDTLEIKRLIGMPNPRVYIPLPKPVVFTPLSESLPVKPYLLGALIGDGSLSGNNFASHHDFADMDISEAIAEQLTDSDTISIKRDEERGTLTINYRKVVGLKDSVEKLGLLGKRAWEKAIPEEYMFASIDERWELLRGLMDTDGTVNKDGGQPSYSTTSEILAKQVQELAWSLGGIAKKTTRVTQYTYKGEKRNGRLSYNVFLRFPKPSMLFKLGRKKELVRDNGQYNDVLKVRIKSIEKVESEPMQCISVAAEDSLYVAKDYIVTHNTKTFQKVMVRRGKRTCIIVRPAYKMKWKKDCVDDETGLYEPGPRVRVVSGVEGIDLLLDDAKKGLLDDRQISTIIIPTTSLKLWLEAHSNSYSKNRINLWEFYDILGVGLVGYDEIHEHFHTVYLSGMILNPPVLVEMSATLKPSKKKEFIRHRYLERFPIANRVDVPYIRVCRIGFMYYDLNVKRFINRANAMAMYNHKTYEDLLYQHGMLDDYFDMVYDIMERGYFKNYQKGQRVLVFFSLIQTCTDFVEYLKKRMKEEGKPDLVIKRYVGEDKYEDLVKSEIAVSTPGKAGTAVDLPGLVMALVTPAIDDRQLNEQIAGRPRRITQWEGVEPRVVFLHARALKKHGVYLNSRREALNPVAKSLDVIHTNYRINGMERENRYLSPTKGTTSMKNPVKAKQQRIMEKFNRRKNKRANFKKRKNKKGRRRR